MRELFVAKKFNPEHTALIDKMNAIIEDYSRQGYDLSLRQLYYQLVARNLVPNTEQSYKRVGGILNDARLAGMVDWEAIVDRGREHVGQASSWDSLGDFMRTAAGWYYRDLWEDQHVHVEVMVEKQALEGVLQPVCSRLRIGFTANKGYSSSSAMYEAGKRIQDIVESGCEVVILYFGDHDPSGIQMTEDVDRRIKMFAGALVQDEDTGEFYETDDYDRITVERIALNMDQVKQYNPPPNPTKLTDSRAGSYLKRFGHTCWELDALEPRKLAQLVEDAVEQYRDEEKWERQVKREKRERMQLISLAQKVSSEDTTETEDDDGDIEDDED